jgi:hypothetical protein
VVNKALLKLMFPGDAPAPSLQLSKQLGGADAAAASRRRLAEAPGAGSSGAQPAAGAPPSILLDQCPLLNASICEATMAASAARTPFLLVAYNPLAQPRTQHIRVPVAAGAVSYAVEGARRCCCCCCCWFGGWRGRCLCSAPKCRRVPTSTD